MNVFVGISSMYIREAAYKLTIWSDNIHIGEAFVLPYLGPPSEHVRDPDEPFVSFIINIRTTTKKEASSLYCASSSFQFTGNPFHPFPCLCITAHIVGYRNTMLIAGRCPVKRTIPTPGKSTIRNGNNVMLPGRYAEHHPPAFASERSGSAGRSAA